MCAEIILSHFESIWWYFSYTFHYLTDEYLQNMRKPVKVEHGCWPPSFACVLRSHNVDYTHHVSYVCALRFFHRWCSWVCLSISHMWGNEVVITYMIRVSYVFERSTVSHDFWSFQQKGVRKRISPLAVPYICLWIKLMLCSFFALPNPILKLLLNINAKPSEAISYSVSFQIFVCERDTKHKYQ